VVKNNNSNIAKCFRNCS